MLSTVSSLGHQTCHIRLYAYVASLAPVGASKAACNGSIIGSIMHANYASKAIGNRSRGHNVYPGSGLVDGGNTLLPA